MAASVPSDRSWVLRLESWREAGIGRLVWYAVEVGVVAGLYYGAARAGLHLAYLHGSVTALWPPVGVGMAALVILGPGVWPAIVIGDLLVADFSTPWGTVLGQTVGNTLEVIVAAVLFRRLTERRIGLERVWDVLALVYCAAAGTLISAVFGALSLRLGHVIKADELGSLFRTWWLADFSGALVFAPFFLVCAGTRSWPMPRARLAEAAVLLAVLVVLIEVPSQRDVPYIVFPVLIWAALRFGPVGAASAVAITSCLTVWNTAKGSGPFVRESLTHSVLATQLFVSVTALTSLVLAALTAERSVSESAQEELTAEQAALRKIATLVAYEAASDRVFEQVTFEAAQTVGALAASLTRFNEDGTVAFVGGWSESGTLAFPIGSRLPLEGTGILVAVRDTGEPQRIDRYEGRGGQVVERLTSFGYGTATAAPVKFGGQTWGALVAAGPRGKPFPAGSERRLTDFADLVAQALANADAYRKLAASRARIVEAADTERRRLERNLHDGAQQRLVSLALQLRLIKANLFQRSSVRGNAPRRSSRPARGSARRAPRARARHPPRSPHEQGPGSRPSRARRPRAHPSRAHANPGQPAVRQARSGDLLLRRRSDHERSEVRTCNGGERDHRPIERVRHRRRERRRRRRRTTRRRVRTRRPHRPRRGARRPTPCRKPARPRYPPLRRDSLRLTDAPCHRWRDDPGVTLSFLLQI